MKQAFFPGLTGNQLKLLALVTMTCDHVGLVLLPQFPVLRIIGRLAFPIYAYMIGEGCLHTRNLGRYWYTMAAFALVCQAGSWIATGSLYQSVLVSFTLAIGLIWLLSEVKCPLPVTILLFAAGTGAAFFLCHGLPALLPGTDYAIDYGFIGVLLPVLVWLGKEKWQSLVLFAVGLFSLAYYFGGNQWWCLAALFPLALYNGQRGRTNMKYLFYVYYPAHLVVIYLLGMM